MSVADKILGGAQATCVQCQRTYAVDVNGEGHCQFHGAPYDSWNRNYPCCSGRQGAPGCVRKHHVPNHHCKYPYEEFFTRVWGIMNYTDTQEEYLSLEDNDLGGNGKEKVYVGKLLAEATRGSHLSPEKAGLIVSVGAVWHGSPHYWHVYTKAELDQIALSGQTLIFKGCASGQNGAYSQAEWIIHDDHVIGVRATAKAATSMKPFVTDVLLNSLLPLELGETKVISVGGMSEFAPEGPYVLPETVYIGPRLEAKEPRKPKTDFPTVGDIPIVIKLAAGSPWKANERSSREGDTFYGAVSIINASNDEITIVEMKVDWKYTGDPSSAWQPVDRTEIRPHSNGEVPFSLVAKKPQTVDCQLFVKSASKKQDLSVNWFDRSWIAKDRPVRFRFTLSDLQNRAVTYIVEYVNPKLYLSEKESSHDWFLAVDNLRSWDRQTAYISKGDGETVFSLTGLNTGKSFEVKELRSLVFKAMQSGSGEVDLELDKQEEDRGWSVRALVDLGCNRVYALRVMMNTPTSAALSYYPVPLYGDVATKAASKLASETKPDIPKLIEVKVETGPDEDPEDSVKPAASAGASAAASPSSSSSAGGTVAVPPEVLARIANLESQLAKANGTLEKMAASMEKLVELMAKK